jgi:hypothetical protein
LRTEQISKCPYSFTWLMMNTDNCVCKYTYALCAHRALLARIDRGSFEGTTSVVCLRTDRNHEQLRTSCISAQMWTGYVKNRRETRYRLAKRLGHTRMMKFLQTLTDFQSHSPSYSLLPVYLIPWRLRGEVNSVYAHPSYCGPCGGDCPWYRRSPIYAFFPFLKVLLSRNRYCNTYVRTNVCVFVCVWAFEKKYITKVEKRTKILCKHRKLVFTTTFHIHLKDFTMCLMEQFA